MSTTKMSTIIRLTSINVNNITVNNINNDIIVKISCDATESTEENILIGNSTQKPNLTLPKSVSFDYSFNLFLKLIKAGTN